MQEAGGDTSDDESGSSVGKPGHFRAERGAHFHAGEDAVKPRVDSVAPSVADETGRTFLCSHPFLPSTWGFCGCGRKPLPSSILGSSLRQDLWRDRILTMHIAGKMHDVFGTGQQRHVPLDDDTVETVIYKTRKPFNSSAKVSISRLLRLLAGHQNHLSWRPVESTGYSLCFAIPSPRDFKGAALGYLLLFIVRHC
jgi:hypothetical protein